MPNQILVEQAKESDPYRSPPIIDPRLGRCAVAPLVLSYNLLPASHALYSGPQYLERSISWEILLAVSHHLCHAGR